MLKIGIAQINAIDNSQFSFSDITLGTLLDALASQPHLPLIFHYDGRAVRGGYHITEVKAGRFSALDCGADPEAWPEIFIQLWDIDEDQRAAIGTLLLLALWNEPLGPLLKIWPILVFH